MDSTRQQLWGCVGLRAAGAGGWRRVHIFPGYKIQVELVVGPLTVNPDSRHFYSAGGFSTGSVLCGFGHYSWKRQLLICFFSPTSSILCELKYLFNKFFFYFPPKLTKWILLFAVKNCGVASGVPGRASWAVFCVRYSSIRDIL